MGLSGALFSFQQHLDLAFGLFQFLFTKLGQIYPLFKNLERIIERKLSIFELTHQFLELLECLFKFEIFSWFRHDFSPHRTFTFKVPSESRSERVSPDTTSLMDKSV